MEMVAIERNRRISV